jgi:hypothetical protein
MDSLEISDEHIQNTKNKKVQSSKKRKKKKPKKKQNQPKRTTTKKSFPTTKSVSSINLSKI